MEYFPPPFFKQGPSARARLAFFALLAFALLFVDARFRTLELIRKGVAVILYPLERAAMVPRDLAQSATEYFTSLSAAQRENEELKRLRVESAQELMQSRQLVSENTQLRRLLEARDRVVQPAVLGEILYEARDPFSRKLVIDKGTQHGVAAGLPAIDDVGVVGQVTRAFPLTSEVTLLTDKDQTIPVQVVRNGIRSVAYGGQEGGLLDLKFMAANADVQQGDVLITSGIDGVYPSGLPVAKVVQIERTAAYGFARILCQPAAGLDRHRHLLVVLPPAVAPPPPPPPDESVEKPGKGRRVRK